MLTSGGLLLSMSMTSAHELQQQRRPQAIEVWNSGTVGGMVPDSLSEYLADVCCRCDKGFPRSPRHQLGSGTLFV